MNRFRSRSLVACLAMLPAFASAQQPRARDTTPFERPKPIATIASTSNSDTIRQLKALLEERAFTIDGVDWQRGELSSIKKDSAASNASDRVLLWLERDPSAPASQANIYFIFGRFEPFFGSTEGPVRVRMNPDEQGRMATLQHEIVTFATSQR